MRCIKLAISYDGSNYSGWQIQPNGTTIQEVIQNAIRKMTGEESILVGSGRTDAGVHALGQVASFRTEKNIPLDGFKNGLNSTLPPDIQIISADNAREDFHPIRDSLSKLYQYLVLNGSREHPLFLNRTWCIKKRLDVELMNKAAAYLPGEHDFSAFTASDGCDENRIKTIMSANIKNITFSEDLFLLSGGEYVVYKFTIKGSGFLKNMVRNIVGSLVDVGLGKITPEDFKSIMDSRDRRKAGVCAPAHGLYLVCVDY